MDTAVVRASAFVGIGIKFAQRELHFAEDRAGIVVVTGLGILFGQTEMARGKHELDFTLHSDDRKHADSNVDVVRSDTVDKIAVKARAHSVGNSVYAHTAMTVGLATLDDLAVEADRRCDLDHNGGKSGLAIATKIAFVEAKAVVFGIGREHRNVLFTAVKDDLFIKCAQALNFLHSAAAKACLERYAEIIAHRYLIKSLVEGNGLDVDIGVYDLNAFTSYRACFVNNFLSCIAQVNAHVLKTVLIARGIENLINADTAKLFFAVSAKSAERTCSFVH